MTVKQKEQEVLALLKATSNSILFSGITIICWSGPGLFACTLPGVKASGSTGKWHGRPYFTADKEPIQSLIDQGLLTAHIEYEPNTKRKYKREFFTLTEGE